MRWKLRASEGGEKLRPATCAVPRHFTNRHAPRFAFFARASNSASRSRYFRESLPSGSVVRVWPALTTRATWRRSSSISTRRRWRRGREHTLVGEDVAHPAFQPDEKLFQCVNGDVLLGHFQTLK